MNTQTNTDENNAKNQLSELLKSIGYLKEVMQFSNYKTNNSNFHNIDLKVIFPNDLIVEGVGEGENKKEAEFAASRDVINKLHEKHPDLIVDWDAIYIDAQAGDALIKLGVYLSGNLKVSDNSSKLQRTETNKRLAKVFDQWHKDKDLDKDLAVLGNHLSEHKKASVVEALLWRRYNNQVITSDGPEHLELLIKAIT